MRINEEFAVARKSEIRTYKPKYFIVSEGSCSEPQYFAGLNNSIISENVTIINILRDYATIRNSHPNFIAKMVQEFLINATADEITVLELKNRIDNFIRENHYDIDINDIYEKLILIYKSEKYRIQKKDLDHLFLQIFKSDIYQDLARNFSMYFEMQDVTYSSTTDKLNIVIDRDKQNFKEFQYDELVRFCKENHVHLYVSNPNFEFWLMLHFPEVEVDDTSEMLENRYVSSSRRYLEKRLHDICKYKKSKLNFKCFEPYVQEAIVREKKYAEDLDSLKNELGSNVGILIDDMLHHS